MSRIIQRTWEQLRDDRKITYREAYNKAWPGCPNGAIPTVPMYQNSTDQVWTLRDGSMLHRADGPALVERDTLGWYLYGQRHRVDGPAIERNTSYSTFNAWFHHGMRHREGPDPAVRVEQRGPLARSGWNSATTYEIWATNNCTLKTRLCADVTKTRASNSKTTQVCSVVEEHSDDWYSLSIKTSDEDLLIRKENKKDGAHIHVSYNGVKASGVAPESAYGPWHRCTDLTLQVEGGKSLPLWLLSLVSKGVEEIEDFAAFGIYYDTLQECCKESLPIAIRELLQEDHFTRFSRHGHSHCQIDTESASLSVQYESKGLKGFASCTRDGVTTHRWWHPEMPLLQALAYCTDESQVQHLRTLYADPLLEALVRSNPVVPIGEG